MGLDCACSGTGHCVPLHDSPGPALLPREPWVNPCAETPMSDLPLPTRLTDSSFCIVFRAFALFPERGVTQANRWLDFYVINKNIISNSSQHFLA